MGAFEDQPVVGLFGTCGPTTFRQNLFIPELNRQNIPYYNPQVADGAWDPSMAATEADHLVFDTVQTWPATGDTYGGGTLAEQGYSIASTLRSQSPVAKIVIPMIEMKLADHLLKDEVASKESIRARKLAAAHLANNASPFVFEVHSLPEMLETSIVAYGAAARLVSLTRSKNPAYQRFVEGRQKAQAFDEAMRSGKLGKSATALVTRRDSRR